MIRATLYRLAIRLLNWLAPNRFTPAEFEVAAWLNSATTAEDVLMALDLAELLAIPAERARWLLLNCTAKLNPIEACALDLWLEDQNG